MNRAMFHQYVSGRRSPAAHVVREVNRQVGRLFRGRFAVEVFLDCAAIRDGLIPSDARLLAKAMDRTLEGLADRGLLVNDWRERLNARIDSLGDKDLQALRRGIESIVLASHQPLIDDITGKTPIAKTSWQPIREALLKHGLGELVREPSVFQVELDTFATAVRKVLLNPPTTVIDRLGDEADLTIAAIRLARSVLELLPRTFSDEDITDIAKSIGVNV